MAGRRVKTSLIIGLSIFIAIMLSILPLPLWAVPFRPQWVSLVVIFWALMLPYRVSVGTAWIVGLLLDIINGTLLGEHACALVIITYVAVKFHKRLQLFTALQRTAAVFALMVFYFLIMFCIQAVQGAAPLYWQYWIPPFTSALFWPWVYGLLKVLKQQFRMVEHTAMGGFGYRQ